MKLEYAKNPQWMDFEKTLIDILVKWDSFNEEHPFTATMNDPAEHGRDLFVRASMGEFGNIIDYVIPEPEPLMEAPSNSIPTTTL